MIKPLLKAMLLCDKTILEEGTHKRSIIGMFDTISGREFPLQHHSLSIYVQFRDVEGIFDFMLELFDVTENKSVNRAVIKGYKAPDKLRDCHLVFEILDVRFTHPGEYEFRIYANDVIFGQKALYVQGGKS